MALTGDPFPQALLCTGVLLASYLLGSIPFGLLVVKSLTGRDIRTVASGRTGGTNAMRAAGPGAGFLTAVLDMLKSGGSVLLAAALLPGLPWFHPLAPLAAVLGHNHSIFLPERRTDGRWRLGGGAGGAAALGGTLGLWPPSGWVLLPAALLVWLFGGYASLTTLTIGLLSLLLLAGRAAAGLAPWTDLVYGLAVVGMLLLALRPNLKRLALGTERRHGLPVWLAGLRAKKRLPSLPGRK